MKILIVSDTHGYEENLCSVLSSGSYPDYVFHLGDSECGGEGIRRIVRCPLYIVAGNCDFFTDLPRKAVVELGGCRMLLTHGHCHYVTLGTDELARDARRNGCNVAIFGHTHKPVIEERPDGLTILNPGSLSFPRQPGRRPSYITMTVNEAMKPEFEIHYL